MERSVADRTDGPARARARDQGLDLLRAMAILGVLVMHFSLHTAASLGLASPPVASMLGYFGVELFFILSGFLIGRILIEVADSRPGFNDWRIFMVRRWMRTLPLYFLWLAVLFLVAPPAADSVHMATLYASFTQNLAWPTPQGWFPVSWSLTTEEWFYLLFSALLLGLSAFRVRGAIPIACALFIALPLAGRFLLIAPDAPFDTGMRQIALFRLDAIAYGVLVAWSLSRWPEVVMRWKKPLFLIGCVVLLVPDDILAFVGDPELFRSWAPLLLSLTSIGFALWIPAFLNLSIDRPWLAAIVRRLSDWSYCLYITHLSVIGFVWWAAGRLHLPVLLNAPIALALAAGLAALSFRYIETPILRRRPKQPTAKTSQATVGAAAVPVSPAG